MAESDKFAECLERIIIPSETRSSDDSIKSRILSKKQSCRLNLDGAVSVLGNLTPTAFSSSSSMIMRDVETLVQRNVQQALYSVGYRPDRKFDARGEDKSGKDDKINRTLCGKRGRTEGGRGEKSLPTPITRQQVCFDCGDQDQFAVDLRCKFPSKYTLNKHRPNPVGIASSQGQRPHKNFFAQAPVPDKETTKPYVGSWSLV